MSPGPYILVCDDTQNIARSLAILIQAAGYRCLAVPSALECVAAARRERPALILMDIMMPGIDGAMASALMRDNAELEGIPIVLVSALPEEQVRPRATEAGAVDFILKPFRKDQILACLRRWVTDPVPPPAAAASI